MDIQNKKVLLIPIDVVSGGSLSVFQIRIDILSRMRQMKPTRIAIMYEKSDDKDFLSKIKAVEFFVFTYCKTAVSSHMLSDDIVDEIMGTLPHNARKKDFLLSIGYDVKGINTISVEDFVSFSPG